MLPTSSHRRSVFGLAAGVLLALISLSAVPQAAHAQTKDLKSLNTQIEKLAKAGKYSEAIELAQQALAITEKARGPDHPDAALFITRLAELHFEQGRYPEVEQLYKRALKIWEGAVGLDHPDLAGSLYGLATLYMRQGRLEEAEPFFKRTLAIAEKALGPDHPNVGAALSGLAGLYSEQGRYSEAEALYKRDLAIMEKAYGSNHLAVARSLTNLASLYFVLGRHGELDPLSRRSLGIYEKALGSDHPHVASALGNRALVLEVQGRYEEAELLQKRALATREKILGPDHPDVATSLQNLAAFYESQRRYTEAEPLSKRALAIYEKALGVEHPDVAKSLNNLALIYAGQGRYQEAELLHNRSRAILEKAFGPDHPDVGELISNLAALYAEQSRFGEAERLQRLSLEIIEKAVGPDHPAVGKYLNNLAAIVAAQGQWGAAVDYWRQSTAIAQRRALRGMSGGSRGEGIGAESERLQVRASHLVKASHRTVSGSGILEAQLSQETFETAQWARVSDAATSVAQMSARGAAGNAALSALVRERQDLVAEWNVKDKARTAIVSEPPEKRNAKAMSATSARLAAIDARLDEIDSRLGSDFPGFAALTSPAPTSVADVQALLGADEALVLFLDTDDNFKPLPGETFIWAVTREKVVWAKSDIGTKELAAKVASFRKPLDLWARVPRALARLDASSTGCAPVDTRGLARADAPCTQSTQFSLALAHELYAKLLGPVAETIKDKKHLILVPSGPLTGLPFNALLTEPPPKGKTTLATMKAAPWIARKHALTILPSASSLKALRRSAKASGATKPFVGFGNPDFRGKPPGGRPSGRGPEDKRDEGGQPDINAPGGRLDDGESPGAIKRVATRGVSDYFRGALADVETLRGALPPLPDTADELKAIATTLAASESDIVLGPKASEATVKAMSGAGTLAAYKVVAFATHGLVAGQLKGLAEPAIALTVPEKASEADDGLLTASEAAALKLDADWVLLSACNTAAGGEPGAEALSGLSRAFFYAGTRALLVSHWEVESSAAVRLTTGTFAALKANPGLGRSQAFRRSMLDLIDNGAPHEAHPAYWAPFFVVGEGK